MSTFNHLLVRRNYSSQQRRMFRRRHLAEPGETTQIVHALKDNHPSHIRRRQHIAIEARKHIWPQAICQQMIASDSLVRHSDVAGSRRTLKTLCQHIRPAIVPVRRGAMPVGNGISKDYYRRPSLRSLNVDARDLVPVVNMLRLDKVGSADKVSMHVIGSGARSWMSCLSCWRRVQVKCNGQIRQG